MGTPEAVAAIREADRHFGLLLSWLQDHGASSDTNILVASDHGYSTITEVIDIETALRDAGFPPAGQSGGVAVATNGGSVLFYASSDTTDRLAEWLMPQPWCGALLASEAVGNIPGALPASLAGLEGPRAPSLSMSFSWDSTPSATGYPGHAFSTSLGPGRGQHGSMSPHETRNIFFARGPAFRQSATVTSPTGNVDLSPTVLHLLGLDGGETMHGRVLHETLRDGPDTVDWRTTTHRSQRYTPGGLYQQAITVSKVGNTLYVEQGSANLS